MTIPKLAPEDLFCGFVLAGLLLALSIADLRRGILPNSLTLLLGVFGLLQSVTVGRPAPLDALIGSLGCAALLLGLAAAFRNVRGSDGLGFGDIKLGAAAGPWLGWEPIPWMLLIASALALVFILTRALWRRHLDRFEKTAFGPFLSAGIFASWASGHLY
ncbi:prepilin peptidase [Bradyrhizobium sp. CNPSo 4010]|uniref:Prepilin peptidase n=1 Tax=Bradyrhizobium agreste TaxID=2751811 RepID=A0ABS0Q106_9BRAD|nr:A24 family peptidase [Bradyrhizobium agreste]MBH5403169.1 prepilin peptidase [Bradyrhizobium agreste]